MAVELIRDIPKGSISDVKKSPMDIFKKAEELEQGVYILNRDNVAGVMLTQQHYEALIQKIDELEEELLDYEVSRRLKAQNVQKDAKTFSLEDVMGKELAEAEYAPDDNGWE